MAYSKQTWDTTSYVNPTRMNHIEDGISDLDNSIEPKGNMWAVLYSQNVYSAAAQTVNTTQSRSLTKYPTLCFMFKKAGILRDSITCPSELFADGLSVDMSYVGGANDRHALTVSYVSDTSVSVSADQNNGDYNLSIYAISNTKAF